MKLSIILPCYKEAAGLPAMLASLNRTLEKIPGEKEIIAIDDGSPDDTWAVLCALKTRYKDLHVVRFARNFGKEAALTCGLKMAKGDVAVMMDSDGQHPPEVIPQMVAKWKNGAKAVCAIRDSRDTDGPLRRALSQSFYTLFRHITDLDMPPGAGDFRLLDRKVIDAVCALPERTRFMKGLMTWVGFAPAFVTFTPPPRASGTSSFAFARLFALALDAITSFSTLPLRVWSLIGVFVSFSSFVYFLWLLLKTLVFGVDTPGFATIMCVMLFLGGIQLISLGVIGEYVGRIFNEVKGRPLYIVADEDPPAAEPIAAPGAPFGGPLPGVLIPGERRGG